MIAILLEAMPIRTAEYTSIQRGTERLMIKDLLVRTEIGTIRASLFGEQARQAEEMNLTPGAVLLVTITFTARKSSSTNGTASYFNDATLSIIEQLG